MTPETPPDKGSSFWRENWIGLSLVGTMVLFMGVMFFMMTGPTHTPRETALEAIILTASSVIASFVITKIFAEHSYNKSLRDHGVQIASGIMVLKRQMEGLTEWIGQKRASLSEVNQSAESSEAILEHVEQTLIGFKGMTDTALGGIAGVIGDALAQYQAVMDQVSTVRLEAFQRTTKIQEAMETAASKEEVVKLQTQVEEIGLHAQKEIAKLARSSALPIPDLPTKRAFTAKCPYCKESNVIDIIDKQGETRIVGCTSCGETFRAHVNANQTITTRRSGSDYISSQASQNAKLEALGMLTRSDWWVIPEHANFLIPLVLAYDARLKKEPGNRTPFNLQTLIIKDEGQLLASAFISNSTVRRFIRLAYHGRAFIFRTHERIHFKGVYINTLSEDSILRAVVWATLTRLASWNEIKGVDVPGLHRILLGGRPGGERIIVETLHRLERGEKGVYIPEKHSGI